MSTASSAPAAAGNAMLKLKREVSPPTTAVGAAAASAAASAPGRPVVSVVLPPPAAAAKPAAAAAGKKGKAKGKGAVKGENGSASGAGGGGGSGGYSGSSGGGSGNGSGASGKGGTWNGDVGSPGAKMSHFVSGSHAGSAPSTISALPAAPFTTSAAELDVWGGAYPFTLRQTNGGLGDRCYVCSTTGCDGCVLPCDDGVCPVIDRQTLTVEYTDAGWKELCGSKHAQSVLDSSAVASRRRASAGISLHDCMRVFTASEQLSADDAWYCPVCRDFQLATKKLDLWRLPQVLVVHLKRFKFTRFARDKLHTLVDFPLDTPLDLSQWIVSPGAHPTYELYAVAHHAGGMGGGHYYADAKRESDEKWYHFNDSSVSPVTDTAKVKGNTAYLLFYKQKPLPPAAAAAAAAAPALADVKGVKPEPMSDAPTAAAAAGVAASANTAFVEPMKVEPA